MRSSRRYGLALLLLLLLAGCAAKTLPPLVNVPALANQPPQAVDQALGRPYSAKPTSDDPAGEWRSYNPPGVDDILVRFRQNRAVTFTVTLSKAAPTAQDALRLIGVHVAGPPTSQAPAGATWSEPAGAFREVSASGMPGEGFSIAQAKVHP